MRFALLPGFACLFAVQLFGAPSAYPELLPVLRKYCFDCHDRDTRKAELNLERFADENAVLAERKTWNKVWHALHTHEMPPVEKPQPSPEERERLTDWIEGALAKPDASGASDPGHVPPRRLNATEYNNTLYDLLGLQRLGKFYDPKRHGGMPEMARFVLQRQFQAPLIDLPPEPVAHGFDNLAEALTLPPFLLEKLLDAAKKLTDRKDVRQGFERFRWRNVPRSITDPEERNRAIVRSYATRAFRRPISDEEAARYLSFYDRVRDGGGSAEDAIAVALQAVLVAPQFLFRLEQGVAAEDAGGVRPLTDYELATRLSYFLWSTMPDAELFRVAADGRLRDPKVLEQQARRMLAHPKAEELAKNFTVQWLQIQNIKSHAPDERVLHPYKESQLKYLGESMMTEVILLFGTIMAEDRSVMELIDADYTWMNGTLGRIYGLELKNAPGKSQPSGHEWYRYPLKDRRRGGVVTSGAILMTTSGPTQTNPVKRGKWMLEAILGQPPPPPLPNVPNLDDTPVVAGGLPVRKKLELHRSDPACAGCHRRLDPLGLALENYNAAGFWREQEGTHVIDATGRLTDGTSFDGPIALKDVLVTSRRGDFVRCLTEHLMTYALGRPMSYYDIAPIQQIGRTVAAENYRFSTLILEIVKSYAFRHLKMQPDKS